MTTTLDLRQELSLRPGELPGMDFVPADPEKVQAVREEVEKIKLRNLRGEAA